MEQRPCHRCAAIIWIIFNTWQQTGCSEADSEAPRPCHQQLRLSPFTLKLPPDACSALRDAVLRAQLCHERRGSSSAKAHMIPLRPLPLPLQVHMPFMRYISVGCVVGIIAGFCIGPGKLLLSSLCCTKERSRSHMASRRRRGRLGYCWRS